MRLLSLRLFLSMAFIYAAVGFAWADACKDAFVKEVAECVNAEISKPGHDAFDTSAWDTCGAKFKPDLDKCRGGSGASTAGQSMAGGFCANAKIGIDWILTKDVGAMGSFRDARSRGLSILESLKYAQRHNPSAQNDLSQCADASVRYAETLLASNGGDVGTAKNGPNDDPKDLSCLTLGPATNNYEAATAADPQSVLVLWSWIVPVASSCKHPVRVKVCLHPTHSPVAIEDHTYGPGYSTPDQITFYQAGEPPGPPPVFLKCMLGAQCNLGC